MVLVAHQFRDWDSKWAHPDDTTRTGVEAEYKLYTRKILTEVASVKGLDFMQFLFDFQAHYDSIVPSLLEEEFDKVNFPKKGSSIGPTRACTPKKNHPW